VEVDARMPVEPVLHLGMLVGDVIVRGEPKFPVGVGLRLDLPESSEEPLMAVPGQALVDDFLHGHVDGGEKVGRSVPLAVVGHGVSTSLPQRGTRLRAVEGLDLIPPVEGEDNGPLRGSHVEPHHISKPLGDVGIPRGFEGVQQVRHEPMGARSAPSGWGRPVSRTMTLVLHCVPRVGSSWVDMSTTSASPSGASLRRRPLLGRSSSASIPWASFRSIHH
jgi:hypothetical protein